MSDKEINWPQIEADYRAGIKSLRAIGKEYGVAESTVRKYAKKEGWPRDLDSQIQERADAIVRKEAVRSSVRSEHAIPEKEIVEANAQLKAGKVIEHRTDIHKFRMIANKLIIELEETGDNVDLLRQLGELLIDTTDSEDTAQAKRLEALNKAISLSSRVGALKQLAETLKILIGLEREAFGLNNDTSDKPAELTNEQLDTKLANLIRKAGLVSPDGVKAV